jgi:hypothetical protein
MPTFCPFGSDCPLYRMQVLQHIIPGFAMDDPIHRWLSAIFAVKYLSTLGLCIHYRMY